MNKELEEAVEKYVEDFDLSFYNTVEEIPVKEFGKKDFIEGAKWQAKKMYSEKDLISFAHFYFKEEFNSTMQTSKSTDEILQEWFVQFKKK